MERQTSSSSQSKQITIDVPADRLAEFYAFFGRFLAGGGHGRGRRGRHGPGGVGDSHPGHGCGHHRAEAAPESEAETASSAPAGTSSV